MLSKIRKLLLKVSIKKLFTSFFDFFNKKILSHIEFNYFKHNLSIKKSKPVFIVGASRSGTALLMQLISNNFL